MGKKHFFGNGIGIKPSKLQTMEIDSFVLCVMFVSHNHFGAGEKVNSDAIVVVSE